jgi:hypothetical protein
MRRGAGSMRAWVVAGGYAGIEGSATTGSRGALTVTAGPVSTGHGGSPAAGCIEGIPDLTGAALVLIAVPASATTQVAATVVAVGARR